MWFFVAVCFLPAFAISLLATWLMRRIAPRWGLIDQPAVRKVHTTPTPLGGGIAIWMGVVLPLAVAHLAVWLIVRDPSRQEMLPAEVLAQVNIVAVQSKAVLLWWILGGGTVLAVMGLVDDFRNLSWRGRLLLQLCVAGAIVAAGVRATFFVPLPWVSAVMSVLWIMVLVNAFNFLDNMDGLSAGIALIAGLLFAQIMLGSISEPRWLVGGVLLVFCGSLTGFLYHNWPPARIFMGDSGSYFIGLMMACTTLLGTFYEPETGSRHVILAPLCILAVPLYDFCSVVLIRTRERRSPFHPDKSHFSHRLVELGLRPQHAVLTIHLATLTTGLGALLLYRLEGWADALIVVALISSVLAIVAILETVGRRNNGSG